MKDKFNLTLEENIFLAKNNLFQVFIWEQK